MSFSEGWFTPLIICIVREKRLKPSEVKRNKTRWAHKALQRCFSALPLLCKAQPIENLLLPPTNLKEIHIIQGPQQAKGTLESCSRIQLFLTTGHKCPQPRGGGSTTTLQLFRCTFPSDKMVGQLLGHYVSNIMHCLEAVKYIQKDVISCVLSFY